MTQCCTSATRVAETQLCASEDREQGHAMCLQTPTTTSSACNKSVGGNVYFTLTRAGQFCVNPNQMNQFDRSANCGFPHLDGLPCRSSRNSIDTSSVTRDGVARARQFLMEQVRPGAACVVGEGSLGGERKCIVSTGSRRSCLLVHARCGRLGVAAKIEAPLQVVVEQPRDGRWRFARRARPPAAS